MKKRNAFAIVNSTLFFALAFALTPVHAQQSLKLSDAEVASVALTANQIDIDQAQLATKKSTNADILNFAKTMTNDHKALIDQAVALATKLNVTPHTNDVTKKLLTDAEKTKQQLEAKKGKEFDKAYIDNEVAYHKAVINAVENVLIPETENEELKALLQNIVPALKTHLSHAEMLQKMLAQ